MCARYRLVRNPDPTGKHKKQALHPRVVPYGTLRVNDLMYQVESRSGLSAGDVKGVANACRRDGRQIGGRIHRRVRRNRLFQSLAFLPSGHGQERDPKRIDPLPQCQLPLREIPEKETENDASRTYAGNPIDSPVL